MYNLNKNKVEKLPKVIKTATANLFSKRMDIATLNSHGFYNVKYLSMPSRRYYTTIQTGELVDNEYVITYVGTARDVEGIKSLMKQELIEVVKEKFSTMTSKYASAEMAGWENLEREAILVQGGTDINACPMVKEEADLCNQSYLELANEIIANAVAFKSYRAFVVSNRYNKTAEIDALQTVDDIILFEATPYEDEVEDEEGVMQIMTLYKNQVKDW